MRRRLAFGVASMAYGKLVSAVIQLAMVPALAAAWGVDLFGQWLMLATIPAFLAASDFGFGTAAGNRLIGECAGGEHDEALQTFQSAFWTILICSLTIGSLVTAAALALPDALFALQRGMNGSEAKRVLLVLIAFGLIGLQGSLLMAAMRAQGAFARSTSFEATVQLCEGAAVIAVALFGGTPFDAALAYLVVRSLGVAGHIALAMVYAPWLRLGIAHARKKRATELLRPSLAAMLLPLSSAGLLQGTALAVGAAAGAAAVPVFTSLRTLSRIVLQLLATINLPILPEFTAAYAKGNRDWMVRAASGIISLNAFVGLFGALGMALGGEWLLAWWSRGTIAAPPAMIWLTSAAILAGTAWNPLSNLLVAISRHGRFSAWYVFAAILTVVGSYFAVLRFGVSGAALAVLIMDLFMLGLILQLIRCEVGTLTIGPRALAIFLPSRLRSTT